MLRGITLVFGSLFIIGSFQRFGGMLKVTPDQLMSQAEFQVKNKEWDKALTTLKEGTKKAPKETRFDMLTIQILRYQKQFPQALAAIQEAQKKEPKNVDLQQLLALTYLDLKQTSEAEKAFQRATELEPHNAKAHNNLAVFYMKSDKFDLAEKALLQAIQVNKGSKDAHLNLGTLYQKQKKIDKAREQYRAYLQMKPRDKQQVMQVLMWLKKNPDPKAPLLSKKDAAKQAAASAGAMKDKQGKSVSTPTVSSTPEAH